MEPLFEKKCIPCEKGAPAITSREIETLKPQIPDWDIITRNNIQYLEKFYTFKNFVQALAFTNKVGQLAEREYHHPTIVTDWGKVTVTWVTHTIKGLHINDFAMAAKTDALFSS